TLASLTFNNTGGTATPTVTGGTLFVTGAITSTNDNYATTPTIAPILELGGQNRTVTVGGASPVGLIMSGVVQNVMNSATPAGLIKAGNGALVLSGASTFAGGVQHNEGTLILGAASTGSAAGAAVTSGPLGTGVLTVASGTSIMGARANVAAWTIANPLVVNGNFTFGGATADATMNNALTLNGTVSLGSATRAINVLSPQVTATLGGLISGSAGGLTKTGNGILVLTPQTTGALSASGAASNATVSGTADLTLSAAAAAGVVAGMPVSGSGIAPGTTVSSVNGSVITLSQNAVATTSGGTFAFGTTRTYAPSAGASGATTLTVSLAEAANLSVGSTVTGVGIAASSTVLAVDLATGVITLSNALTATVTGQNITFGGATATAGFNSYAGTTTVSGGSLRLSSLGALPNATDLVVLFGGTLDLAASTTVASLASDSGTTGGLITASGTSGVFQLSVSGSASSAFGGVITNNVGSTLNLNKQGSGSLTLGGPNSYSGSTTVGAGSLLLTGNGSLPIFTALNVSGAAAVFNPSGITASSLTVGSLAGAAGATVSLGAKGLSVGGDNTSTTFAGAVTGASASLTKTGDGTLTLSGANTFGGGLTVSGGTLSIGAGGTVGAVGPGPVSLAAGTFLVLNRSDVQTLASGNLVTGAGAVTLAGTGAVTAVVDGQFNTTGALNFGAAALAASASSLNLTNASSTFGSMLVRTTASAADSVVNTVTVGSGKTFAINGGVTVGGGTSAINYTDLTVSGPGTFAIGTVGAPTNANVQLGVSGGGNFSNNVSLNLSGLGTFAAYLGTGSFNVGQLANTDGAGAGGTRGTQLLLAPNSTISAASISTNTADPTTVQFRLGTGANVFQANTITIGGSTGAARGRVALDFQTSSGTFQVRNQSGTGRADMNVQNGDATTGYATSGTVDLSAHSADLLLGTLAIGGRSAGTIGSGTGAFTFDTGVLDATTVTVASRSGTTTTTGAVTGTLNLGGGSVTIGTLNTGVNSATTATSSAAATATLAISGAGTVGITTWNMGSLSTTPGDTAQVAGGPLQVTANISGGTTTVGTLTMNTNSSSGTGTNKASAVTLNISGGSVTVGASGLRMANASNVNASATSTINLTGGILTMGAAITRAGGVGTETTTLNLNGGTLDMGGFAIGGATTIGTVTLASGTLRNVAQINNGASLVKTTVGTLLLTGTNAYTGSTVVNQGVLRMDSAFTSSSALQFGSADTVTTVGGFEAAANLSFGGLTALFNGSTNASTLTVESGRTLTITGNVALGSTAANSTMRLNGSGSGSLVITNAGTGNTVLIGSGTQTAVSIVDLGSLASLTSTTASGNFQVSSTSGTNSTGYSVLTLPAASTITAATLTVGGSGSYNGIAGQVNQLRLGSAATLLNVGALNIGTGTRDLGSVTFAGASGSLTVRAANGTSATPFNMGSGSATTAALLSTNQNTFDTTGHQADLKFSTVTIGTQNRVADLLNVFSFDQGTLEIGTLNASSKSSNGGTTTTNINIGGGTVTSGAWTLASNSGPGTAAATVTLSGGTVTLSGNILRGAVTGAGSGAATLTLDGATLDMGSQTIGSATNPVTFNAMSGTLRNVSQINGGGAFTKSGAGVLNLTGSNAFTGATLITGGTLSVAAGALSGTSGVTVNGAALTASNINATAGLTIDATATATLSGVGVTLGAVSNANATANALNFTGASGKIILASLAGAGSTRFGSDADITAGISGGTVTVVGALGA
ncbi:MAG: beta strand repeat-containing protein, partial [Ilumatobacteraceae bacterium]